MCRNRWLILVAATLISLLGCEQPAEQARREYEGTLQLARSFEKIRQPAVAGTFYPRHKEELAEAIDAHLQDADPPAVKNLRGLVCPHAGYRFSGPVAAFAYKLLEGRDLETVIVMAPSHCATFRGASIPDADAYETPLGLIPLSPKTKKLAAIDPFVVNPPCEVHRPDSWRQTPKELPPFGEDTPHTWEHSLEVQLPFLQKTLKNYSLVPIVFGDVDPEAVARALLGHLDEKTLLVASSDLSHFHPYETAKGLDTTCVEAICRLNTDWMDQQEACGKLPILALMQIAKEKGWKAKLLDYRNSGDTSGDKTGGVVGYAAIAFFDPNASDPNAPSKPKQTPPVSYSPDEREYLLDLARKTVEEIVGHQRLPKVNEVEVPEKFTASRACFVTLTKNDQLRGCIGNIFPQLPLYKAVLQNAAGAAVADERFTPVAQEELDQIEIEISVLTIPQPVKFTSPEELLEKLRPGVDGVVLRVGRNQSTYLPQVWAQLTDKEEFLARLSEKAGLPPSAWKDPKVSILRYQVEAFGESER